MIWEFYYTKVLHMFFITQDGESALMIAAREGMTEVVSLLQEVGANTDLQNEVNCRCDLGNSIIYPCFSSHRMENLH